MSLEFPLPQMKKGDPVCQEVRHYFLIDCIDMIWIQQQSHMHNSVSGICLLSYSFCRAYQHCSRATCMQSDLYTYIILIMHTHTQTGIVTLGHGVKGDGWKCVWTVWSEKCNTILKSLSSLQVHGWHLGVRSQMRYERIFF